MKIEKIKNLISNSTCGLIEKNTVVGLIRSILSPLAEKNPKSLVFTRLRNKEEIGGLIKRLEYSNNVEMYDFLDTDIIKRDDFVEIEFILLTSSRFSAFLAWDYSISENKNKTKFYFLMNSKLINDCFEILQAHSKKEFSEDFYSYKPERRDNELLNEALSNIVNILNENICENEFINKEEIKNAKKLESLSDIKASCHEIKNQLSILDIHAKLIEKETGENKNIEMIRKAISLINVQLGEIKGFEAEGGKLENITIIVNDAIEMLFELTRAHNNKIVFKNNVANLDVELNYEKFVTVLANVLKNANESTKNDTIEIEMNKNGNHLNISIKNNGNAIQKELQAKIFEDGFSTKENGWGIGLSVCKKYLERENSKITLKHSDENCTEFLIEIPLNMNLDELGIYI